MACLHTVGLMSSLWKPNHSIRKWVIPWPFEIFRQKHKSILKQISTVLCMGILLHGDYNNELCDQVKVSKYARKMQDKFLPLFNAIWNHGVWLYAINRNGPEKKGNHIKVQKLSHASWISEVLLYNHSDGH